ncbi:MAG: hypothetical protein WC346_02105 [Methanogenium sp.]|jgi:hypothetical protein
MVKSTKRSSTSGAKSKSKYETIEMTAKRWNVSYSVAKFCRQRGVDPRNTYGIFVAGRMTFAPLFESKQAAQEYLKDNIFPNLDRSIYIRLGYSTDAALARERSLRTSYVVKKLSDVDEIIVQKLARDGARASRFGN